MAIKSNTKSSQKRGRTSSRNDDGLSRWAITRFIIGIVLVFLAIYMIMAFSSFLYSGASDFVNLDGNSDYYAQLASKSFKTHNVCGGAGAKVAFFLIDECFGWASYIIPIYFIMLGVKFIGAFKIRAIRWFIILGLIMIWGSITLNAVSQDIQSLGDLFYHIGGKSGQRVVDWLTTMIGEPGVYGAIMLSALLMLIYLSKKTIIIVQAFFRMERLKTLRDRLLHRLEREEDGSEETVPDPTTFTDPTIQQITEWDKLQQGNTAKEQSAESISEETSKQPVTDGTISLDVAGGNDNPASVDSEIIFSAVPASQTKPQAATPAADAVTGNNEDIAFQFDKVSQTAKASGDLHRGDINTPYDPKKDLEFYKYPTLSLLDTTENSTPTIDMDEQNANKERIINVLHSFGVEISSIKATIGPTITLYEITPAEGMRISKIRNLEDDIALSLAAEGIRIIAPIPGKGTIGIEVPNKKKCIVSMESILNSKTYQESKMELPCALGKTITNEVFMIDLAKAPHLLVAGATGMGKSVGLNAIVTSLLYKKHPSELKIVMVDPKKVEFSIYNPIENHFLAKLEDEDEPIITDVQKVVKTLNSLCQLMDTRYDLLKAAGVRNIKEYNQAFKERKLNPMQGHDFMPYYVVIIDEFGDLIMTAGKEIELPICRIAQLARAVGIHMIIATQRPTAQIITGTIKANFPARIAFRVAAMMDSRIILDRAGANQLIGRGDMLYLNGGDPTRVQCAFVDTPEVSKICTFISKQQGYPHAAYLPEPAADGESSGGSGSSDADLKHLDPMFEECARLIVSSQSGSTSLLQRNYSIGYNRAGKIMDQLQKAGIVGAQIGSKPREVLVQDMNTLERMLENLR